MYAAPSLGTCATHGEGVFEGLERITRLVLRAYEAELPKGEQPSIGLSVGGAEVSIAEAIRGLAEAPLVTKVTPFHGMAAVRPEETKPSAESEARLAAARATMPPVNMSATAVPPQVAVPPPQASAPAPAPGFAPAPAPSTDNGVQDGVAPPPDLTVPTIAPPPGTSHFSLAELWPEAERVSVRQTETLIGARDAHGAVLACDLLLTRVLASAAGLAGAADAPRDPGLVSLLLGLDGKRYLVFRSSVRAARQREEAVAREARSTASRSSSPRGRRGMRSTGESVAAGVAGPGRRTSRTAP